MLGHPDHACSPFIRLAGTRGVGPSQSVESWLARKPHRMVSHPRLGLRRSGSATQRCGAEVCDGGRE